LYNPTKVIAALRMGREEGEDIVSPIHVSVIYRFTKRLDKPSAEVKYGRENNPSVILLERALSIAENAKWCLAFNTGMAAINSLIMGVVEPGSKILASKLLYGSTRSLLDAYSSRLNLKVAYRGPPWDELLSSIDQASAVIVETIGNPTLRVPPLREIAKECRNSGCTLIVDNTFASPYLYQPLRLGEDVIVLESITKYIGGHNDVMGGVVCGLKEEDYERLWDIRRLHGTILQPLDAFLAARGLKTLHLRMRHMTATAARLAETLQQKQEEGIVARVYYPGLRSHPDHTVASDMLKHGYGAVVSFDVGSERRVREIMSRLNVIVPAPSLGGVESVISYPYESSHRNLPEEERLQLGITEGLLRLSVGLEDPEDIVNDILNALNTKTRLEP